MIKLEISHKGQSQELSFEHSQITIGKSTQCELIVKGWFVADKHSRIKRLSSGYVVEDCNRGANGTLINGKRVDYYGPIDLKKDELEIGAYRIRFLELPEELKAQEVDMTSGEFLPGHDSSKRSDEIIDSPTNQLKRIDPADGAYKDLETKWILRCRSELLKIMDLRRKDVASMTSEELRKETKECLEKVLTALETDIPALIQLDSLRKRVIDEAVGLGPLEDLLEDESVTEIMVNARNEIFVEKSGQIQRTATEFTTDKAVIDVIERIVSPLGRKIDESSPMVDARLPDGSRVNAIIPPLAIKGPTITIRKFPSKRLTAEDLVGYGSMTDDMAAFLKICVKHKKNIIISGGTGSGKTTLLNVLSCFIPDGERVITIEDAAELQLNLSHLISLESRPSNSEGRGAVQIRDLVRNSLRMRPDRIVVGECRGAEALDMLQAMNTGHEGSLTTLHSNSPRDAIARMETMVMMAGMDLPITAIRDQITSAIDVIVQQTRLACGSRKITYITEVTGMESGKIQLQDIFRFHRTGFNTETGKTIGRFGPEGVVPSFYDELRLTGVEVDLAMFGT